MRRFVIALSLAALAAAPAFSRAGDAGTQWEVIRVYKLVDGRAVALAFPAEWQEVAAPAKLEEHSKLRFVDESGKNVEIPVTALLRASMLKPMLWAEDARKLALKSRKPS